MSYLSMTKENKNKIAGIIMIIVGIFSLLFGVLVLLAVENDKSDSIKATATVVDYDIEPSSGKKEYQSILEYTNQDGKIVQFKDPIANYEPRFEINEKVEILYVPSREHSEQINTLVSIYFLPFILIFFGFGSIIFGNQFYKNKMNFENKARR
ncbi:DUF3592 domain-containing protein [Bernardetia sp. ABR2-2B]|uniref:DUF3592 domain-containing protein n=1 Tax=Bernardetia sp. ABR2-2B TaxID=3127472 RepID=UPI0030D42FB2